MSDLVLQLRALSSGTPDEVALARADVEALQTSIQAELNQEHPQGKEAALLAYASAMIKTCPEFRGSVKETLTSLVETGFLMEVGKGNGIRIYGGEYALAKDLARNAEAKSIGEALTHLVDRTVAAGRQKFETDFAALKGAAGQNQLSVADLKSGKEGRLLLETPDQQHRGRFYKGGFLLVESTNGGQIRALDAVGGPQRIVRQLAGVGTYVWNTQLGSERLEMKERLPEEVFRNVLILHGLIYRGIILAEKAEAVDQRKEEFKKQTAAERLTLKASATLTLVEFFIFGRIGSVLLDPLGRKPFEIHNRIDKDSRPTLVWDVIALIERNAQNQIRVANCPERLTEFFADFREYVATGEKFVSVKWPLGNLLRMGYASALAEATPEQKSEAARMVAEAEAARKTAEVEDQTKLATELLAGTCEEIGNVTIPDPNEGR